MIRKGKFLLLASLLAAHGMPSLHAAESPFPETDELVQQMERLREVPETEPPVKEKKPVIKVEEPKAPDSQTTVLKVKLTHIELEGNEVFKDKDFAPMIQEYLNREIEFNDLRNLTNMITEHYRKNGYVTSRAYLPPQKIVNGTITINVLEGKIGIVYVNDNKFFNEHSYKGILFKPGQKAFRYQDLERGLYEINASPDRKAKAYLIAGLEPGTSDIIIKAKEKFPLHFSYEFSNRGSKSTHRARHTLQLWHNSLFKFGDRFIANLTLTEENALIGNSFQYEFPYLPTGTTVTLQTSIGDSRLIKNLKPFEIEGESFSITPSIRQQIFHRRRFTADLTAGFEIKDSQTTIAEDKLFYDRMRVIKIGPEFLVRDRWGQTYIDLEYRYGIPNFLGSLDRVDNLASRPNSGGEFTSYVFDISRTQRLPKSAALSMRLQGQWTWDTLTSLEQFRAGGVSTVRGYPESDASGDYGYTFSSEVKVPPYFIPRTWKIPKTNESLRNAIRLLGFLDGGKTYNHHRSDAGSVKDKFLLAAGFGVRFYLKQFIAFQMDWGFPFGDKSSDDKDSGQIHLSARVGI